MPDSVMGTSQYAKSIAQNVLSQVYSPSETGKITVPTAVYIVGNGTTGVLDSEEKIQDLLDNGPKNEVYLAPGETLVFTIDQAAQVGVKCLNGGSGTIKSTGGTTTTPVTAQTDMFYAVAAGTVTITNNGSGTLAVTELKFTSNT